MTMSIIAPILAVVSLIAGVIGAHVGVKFTAKQAQITAEATQAIVQGLVPTVAVLQTEVRHLTHGLHTANKEVEKLHTTVAQIQRDVTQALLQ